MTDTRVPLGSIVRDTRTGLTGKVIATVNWDAQPTSLIVQPEVRPDHTVPPTVYVVESLAEVILYPTGPKPVQ